MTCSDSGSGTCAVLVRHLPLPPNLHNLSLRHSSLVKPGGLQVNEINSISAQSSSLTELFFCLARKSSRRRNINRRLRWSKSAVTSSTYIRATLSLRLQRSLSLLVLPCHQFYDFLSSCLLVSDSCDQEGQV